MEAKEIALRLVQGQVVAIPTDTVYGMAADLHSTEGIASIYALKKRSKNKSLILFLPDVESIQKIPVVLNDRALEMIQQFWPGDVTIVLNLTEEALKNPFWRLRAATDGSIALRVPKQNEVCELMRKYKLCLMTTSANLSGEIPCQTITEIEAKFGADFPILDGDNGMSQIASTIIDCRETPFKLIREGKLCQNKEFMQYLEV